MKIRILMILFLCLMVSHVHAFEAGDDNTMFDDKTQISGFARKYDSEPKSILIEMIKDNELTPYMTAAAVRVFRQHYSKEIVSTEKKSIERLLLFRLNRSNSSFVDIEIMHTLLILDRYKYFVSMVPTLLSFLDHYNDTVNEMAYASLKDVVINGPKRSREARVVFENLRKYFYISRRKLEEVDEPGFRLKQKLEFVRWAIKVLGTQELQRLPSAIIDFL